jgi:hypothetical protein
MWDNFHAILEIEGFIVIGRMRLMWLWCWLGALVAGCAHHPQTVAGNASATLPLLTFMRPTSTLTPTPRPPRLPTSTLLHVAFSPTPFPLRVTAPVCYETPFGSLWCLGELFNNNGIALDQIVIRLYLTDAQGNVLAQAETALPRTILFPGEQSPYGILFRSVPASMENVIATVARAEPNTTARKRNITLNKLKFSPQQSAFVLSGTIQNNTGDPLSSLIVVVTLKDAAGRVTGFRQVRLSFQPALPPEGQYPFVIDLIPQGLNTITYSASTDSPLP